jgi:PKHD-type hydroxylase
MSNYIFAPSPSFGVGDHPFVTYREAFNQDEIDKLINILDSLKTHKGTVGGASKNDDISNIRKSNIAWLSLDNETEWIYNRLALVARLLNGEFYKFDLYGFFENMQYTLYNGDEHEHYTWHQDTLHGTSSPPRKLSMVLQLSGENEYEGGNLEIMNSSNPLVVDKQKGLIAAFPSYMVHRVTPVTSGIRKTLVVWVCGPSFR